MDESDVFLSRRANAPARGAVLPAERTACACSVVRRAARLVTSLYDDALASSGLRITQYSLLANLDRYGRIGMTELARSLAMDRTTLTRNLGPLERDGLIALVAAGHGRAKLVALTLRGRRRLREAYPLWQQAQQQFAHVVGGGETLHLERIANALNDGGAQFAQTVRAGGPSVP